MNVKLAHFDLLEEIGHGGLGVVFRAFDPSLNRYVAIKVLKDEFAEDPEFVQGFLRESQNAAAISHPHIVQIYFIGEFEGNCYMVMELVNGRSLEQIVQQEGPMPEAKALRVAIEITEALKAAYVNQMVHGDIKPQNILVSEESGAKLLDFGLAQLANVEVHDSSEGVWGSPYYISPERVGRKAEDFRSDIYSLGATIFEALVGHPPFEAADPTELAIKRLSEKPPLLRTLNPNISKRTEQIINKMLHKNLLMRYLDYDSLLNELRKAESAALGKEPLTDTMEMRRLTGYITAPVPVPTQRSLLPMILGVSLASCAVVGGGIYFLIGKKAATQTASTPAAVAGPTPLSTKYGTRIVKFNYINSSAIQVALVGDFDGWQPEPMSRDQRNPALWTIMKEMPLGIPIEYQFVVDGARVPDPAGNATNFPDGRGSYKTRCIFGTTPTPAPKSASTPTTAPPNPSATASASDSAAQKSGFGRCTKKADQFLKEFKVPEAQDVAGILSPADPQQESMKAIILKKIASETDFKKRLETDINRIGYPMPIDTLDKRHLEGVAHKADSKEIVVTIPSGDIKVRWPDLSPVTLLAMHEYFTAKETNPEQAALRNRDAGVTAGCLGLTKESQALMDKASQKNPVLREEMPRSPQSKSPTPSPSPSPADTAMLKAEFDRNMPKFLLLLREFRWKQIPLNKIRTSNPDDEAQKTLLSKKVAREAEFQKRLVADINRIGYPLPVEKANKQRIEGAVRQATEEEIVVTVASGNLSLHWNDLSPSTLLAMHEYFTAKETNPEQLARRNWEAGVTAVCLGLTTEGQALMEKAAQKTPSLRDEMQLMLKP